MKRLHQFLDSFTSISLPGPAAQAELSGFGRPRVQQAGNAKKAAVLLYVFPDLQGNYRMCFIKRTSRYPSDPHAGQISFPGGKREPQDNTDWDTAIREAKEEVGILPGNTKKIGALSPLYIPVSNFIVHPFLSSAEEAPNFQLQEEEVDAIITPKISDILDQNSLQYREIKVGQGRLLKDVPHFYLEKQIIWGATAMILNEFKASLLNYQM